MTETEIPLREATVDLPGASVHYVESGSGSPVIFTHGYADFSTWRVWQANLPTISAEYRAIGLDLPGYGESKFLEREKPTEFLDWFETYSHTLHDFIEALDLAPVTLCGLSAGGCASMLVAEQWPSLVSKLILVDSAGSEAADRWKSSSNRP